MKSMTDEVLPVRELYAELNRLRAKVEAGDALWKIAEMATEYSYPGLNHRLRAALTAYREAGHE